MEKENRKTPTIFAGVKFFDLLIDNLRACDSFAINGDYDRWILCLFKVAYKIKPYCVDKNITSIIEELKVLNNNILSTRNAQQRGNIGWERLLKNSTDKILECEMKLYQEARDILLKSGSGETDINYERWEGV